MLEVTDFAVDAARYLRASWRRGAPVVVVVDGNEFVTIDTVEDLEFVHAVLQGRAPAKRPTRGCTD